MEKEITTVLERRVIPEVTAATKNAIKRKTAFNLPDRPSDMGMKPSEIKKAFWSPVIDDEYSVLSELERVIHDINVAFDELVYPPFEDGEGKNAGVQDAESPNRAIGDGTLALGNGTVAGSRAYRIKDYDSTARRYYLDVAANDDAWLEGIEVEVDCYSIYWRFRRTKFGKITFAGNVDGKACIAVDNFFEPGVSEAEKQEYLAEAYIYIVGKPHLGTVTIGATAVSSGIGTVAAESETDAGGRNTVSDGKYAFSRGYGNVTGYCGASFGQDNENLGLKGFAGGGQGNYIGPNVERAAVFNFLNTILANDGAAFGQNNKVDVGGVRGFAAGLGNVVNRANQAKFGKYSPTDTSALFSVGNGTSDTARKMAFGVWEDGHAEVQSVGISPKSVVHKKYVTESCNTAESNAKTYADGTGDYSTNGFVPIQPDKTSLKKGSGYSAYVLFGDSNNLDANGNPVQTPQLKAISRGGIGNALAQYGSNGRLSDKGSILFSAYGNAELPNKKAIADYLNDGTAGYLKTVKDAVDAGINAFATEVTDNGAVDKFAELVSYVSEHGGEAKNMATAITDLQNNKADNTHNHDGVYSPVGHNHDDIYSKPGHTHNYAEKNGTYSAMTVGKATKATQDGSGNVIETTYAKLADIKDSAFTAEDRALLENLPTTYAPINHNHNSDYASRTHNHDGVYSPVNHTHDYAEKTGTYSDMTVGKATTADSATKATQDGNGKNIATTYATKDEVSALGTFASYGRVTLSTSTNTYVNAGELVIIEAMYNDRVVYIPLAIPPSSSSRKDVLNMVTFWVTDSISIQVGYRAAPSSGTKWVISRYVTEYTYSDKTTFTLL